MKSAFIINIPTSSNGNLIGIKSNDSLDMEEAITIISKYFT